jgi:competence protein ComEC
VVSIESVLGPGDYATERVRIIHAGGRDVLLQGWRLLDEQGNEFIFPQLTLKAGSLVFVHTRSGANTVTDLFWGQAKSVWQAGEQVVLKDASNVEIDRFMIP